MNTSNKGILVTCFLLILGVNTNAQTTKVVIIPMGDNDPPEVRAGSELYANSIGMKFSMIPAGSFVMGSPAGTGNDTYRPHWPAEGGRSSSELQHVVILSKDFYMQTTEVTQAQYEQIMGINPAYFSASGAGADCGPNCPVENVSWNEAQNFIDALNARENRSNCNTQPNTCYSLPTEAQWEYAARGTTNSAFYNGDITATGGCASDTNLELIAWYCFNSGSTTHPVAQKAANQWGLYDMSGNVWEWCEDWQDTYADGPVTDPVGGISGSSRVVRGGAYPGPANAHRSARRFGLPQGWQNGDVGFRLVIPSG